MPALDSFRSSLQPVLEAALDAHAVPGAVVAVARGSDSVAVAAGLANVSTGVECTPDTLFQIGSISKVYTASLVMQLVHAGLIELDEPVRGALQEFRVEDDSATLTITPRHLLSHTSGLQGDHFLDCGRNPDALWRYVSTLDTIEQLTAPDELFSYCNAGYGVLGRLVEEVTGDHYARALLKRLVRPLGVDHTVALAEHALLHRVAVGHRPAESGGAEVVPWGLARFELPIGALIASAPDLVAFGRLHLDGGKVGDRQVLPAKAVAQMRASEVEVPGSDEAWGLGWNITRWGGTEVLGHDGNSLGQRSFFRVFPEADAALAVLTNSMHGSKVALEVFEHVGAELLHLEPPRIPEPLALGDRSDAGRYAGIFERLHQRLAIAGGSEDGTLRMTIIPDELFARAGISERTLTLLPLDEHRFVTEDPDSGVDQVVTMIDDDDGEPAFVHYERRAHARIA